MTGKAEITTRLAGRLKEERAAKGLSMDALAKLSGLSRSMLSQIERGESSPTVASLWNLTRALNVDFSALLDQEAEPLKPIRQVIPADQTPTIRNRAAGCEVRILSAPEEVGAHEVYDISFAPGAALESTAHKKGCVEHFRNRIDTTYCLVLAISRATWRASSCSSRVILRASAFGQHFGFEGQAWEVNFKA